MATKVPTPKPTARTAPHLLFEDEEITSVLSDREDSVVTETDEKSAEEPNLEETEKPEDKASRFPLTNADTSVGTEVPNSPTSSKKIDQLTKKADHKSAQLANAQKKLPTANRLKLKTREDESKKVANKLHFEKEVISQGAHIKGPLLTRPIQAVANVGIGYAHTKMYQVEQDNVALKAAHHTEILAEGALRTAYRFHKSAPYRKVEKFEHQSTKANENLTYHKALEENPQLKSKVVSRTAQKQKIKRDYAKAAHDAKKAGKTTKEVAKETASLTEKIVSTATEVAKAHPGAVVVILILLILILVICSAVGSCSSVLVGSSSIIFVSSYLADDADIDMAELSYTEWETDLRIQIANVESDYPGYDEYRYDLAEIGHNPFELMGFLTAVYQDFTYRSVQPVLAQLFNEQYTLTIKEDIEIRYYTEPRTNTITYIDPVTGETISEDYEYQVEVPYNYYILNVTLTSHPLTTLTVPRLNAEQAEIYGLLMQTHGNRQYVRSPFDFNWLPFVSGYYGYRVNPFNGTKNYHKGVDIAVEEGTSVKAGFDGVVTLTSYDPEGYGYYVTMQNKNGVVAKYAHLSQILVSAGQSVKSGDEIAKTGNTGNSTGPHLHLEVLKSGQYLNPLYFAATGNDSR